MADPAHPHHFVFGRGRPYVLMRKAGSSCSIRSAAAATMFGENGVGADVIQQIGGWKTQSMVDHYQDMRFERMADAMASPPGLPPTKTEPVA